MAAEWPQDVVPWKGQQAQQHIDRRSELHTEVSMRVAMRGREGSGGCLVLNESENEEPQREETELALPLEESRLARPTLAGSLRPLCGPLQGRHISVEPEPCPFRHSVQHRWERTEIPTELAN